MQLILTIGAGVLVLACGAALWWVTSGGLVRLRAARGKPPAPALSRRGRIVAICIAVALIVGGLLLGNLH